MPFLFSSQCFKGQLILKSINRYSVNGRKHLSGATMGQAEYLMPLS